MLWVKAFHIIAMVTWFAGMFYLPRLFVYHAMSDDQISHERFKIMERKLYYGIMTPGAVVTIGLGLWLLMSNWDAYMVGYHWMHIKLALVGGLIFYHLWCGALVKRFKLDQNSHTHVWYRWFNEAPVMALIAIVILAVVRPI